ncbi:STAS domain-containing protein [Streptomyces sp. BH-SS-21]|uniref:Anti-sigma factor antagonist n=1 Tax=Streptomyces liliiviolaceus TaxID=2823109 RepID=A0A941BB08_9ACTN|nr:STAS domain-containing protein [Streptomyces liliiviolaceus]MBQ0851683.1 STAS domain-containing protein [Streptomyces liliiviolaceus]
MPPQPHDHAAGPSEDGTEEPGLAGAAEPGAESAAASGPESAAGFRPPPANPYAHSYPGPGFVVVEVLGEIDMATAGALGEHLDALTSAGVPQVVVDLRKVEFFDCSGLRVLCRAERRARELGGTLRLVSDRPRIHRLLRACDLLGRFPPLAELPPAPPAPPASPGPPAAPED